MHSEHSKFMLGKLSTHTLRTGVMHARPLEGVCGGVVGVGKVSCMPDLSRDYVGFTGGCRVSHLGYAF